jgi:hypothetical protein
MKRIFLASVIALIATSGTGLAQPSQGQAGAQAGVNGNAPNAPDSLMQDNVGVTTGMGPGPVYVPPGPVYVPYPQTAPMTDPSMLGPPREGYVGPGPMDNNGPPPGQR